MTSSNDKSILILGAGFSVSANIPTQENLFSEIDNWASSSVSTHSQKEKWNEFKKFFKLSLGKSITDYNVEDIFTIFDISQIQKEGFRSFTYQEIQQASHCLLSSIRQYLIYVVDDSFRYKLGKYSCYADLATKLLDKRHNYGNKDKMSIISLNWDNYFDKMLAYRISSRHAYYQNAHDKNMSLDYCTYDYSLANNKSTIPSILKKASGYTNLKILKPHGSTNWGYCSNCTRLYISDGEKIKSTFECIKYCNKRFKRKHIALTPIMITPTFLKDLGNLHLKNVWSNAGIEISEANKLIFIGYSLRPEDFYFRQLLAKSYRSETEIYVYDFCNAAGLYSKKEKEIKNKYMNFFQKSKIIEVKVDGWENNIDEIVNNC
jgi:NAD-dependent SIR2 family protein deacetylase